MVFSYDYEEDICLNLSRREFLLLKSFIIYDEPWLAITMFCFYTGLGKKKSKCCCQFRKSRKELEDSSSEEEEECEHCPGH